MRQIKTIYPLLIFLTFWVLTLNSYAQDSLKYVSAKDLVVLGKAKPTPQMLQRIGAEESKEMPRSVQNLALNSAGISIIFETNSSIISVRWKLAEDKYFANMTPIAHSGLDLYCLKNNKWQYAGIGKPAKGVVNQDQIIVKRMDTTLKQFMLYLPLYNSVTDLQIGVDRNSVIKVPERAGINQNKRIVVYGSSIVQGASASRPGMAYPAIIQRKMNVDVINLGFSGSAKMEIELAKYLATVPADCYVLDCVPNQTPDQINERALPFIKYLRSKRPQTPIVLVESVIRETGYFDQDIGKNVHKQNENFKRVYQQLKAEKYTNIYYLEARQLTGNDHESTIDGTHLTDLGFTRIAEAIAPVLRKVL